MLVARPVHMPRSRHDALPGRIDLCWPRGLRLGTVLAALLLIAACGHGESPDPAYETVEPPAALAELDLAVREQFHALWAGSADAAPASEARRNWGELGMWFHVYRFEDSAVRCYRNALLIEPDDPRWPYFLGMLSAGAGDAVSARRHFERALALAPDAAHIHVYLADLALTSADLQAAEDGYRRALAANANDPAARLGLGKLSLQRGDARAALSWIEPLAAEQPEAGEVLYPLAAALRQLGEHARALDLMRRIPSDNVQQIALAREDPWWKSLQRMDRGARQLSRRGVRAARQGRQGEAAVLFGAAVRADPEGPEERVNYALALAELGRLQEAMAQLEKALQLAPDGSDMRAKVRLERGRLLARAGRTADAERAFRALIEDRPTEAPPRIELSRLLHSRGDLESALVAYEGLRELGRNDPELAFWHAAALLGLGQIHRAADQLRSDAAQLPDAQRLSLLRLRTRLPSDARDREALNAEIEALADATAHPDVLFAESLAMAMASLDRFAHAERWQRAAVEALTPARMSRPLQIAQRRLTLYREGKPARTRWERLERPIDLPVVPPGSPTTP